MTNDEFKFFEYKNKNEVIKKIKHIYAENPLTVINWLYRL